jgi:hypothetical protein
MVFGCVCYVHNLGPRFNKLDPCATKCVFLGYSTTQKEYCCYSLVLRRYFTSADVTFVESIMICCFLRLSIVRIFPRAANQAKKCHSQRNLGPPNTLPRKINAIITDKDALI